MKLQLLLLILISFIVICNSVELTYVGDPFLPFNFNEPSCWSPVEKTPDSNDDLIINNQGWVGVFEIEFAKTIDLVIGQLSILGSLNVKETLLIEYDGIVDFRGGGLLQSKNLIIEGVLYVSDTTPLLNPFLNSDGYINNTNILMSGYGQIWLNISSSLYVDCLSFELIDESNILCIKDSYLMALGKMVLRDNTQFQNNGAFNYIKSFDLYDNSRILLLSSVFRFDEVSTLNQNSNITIGFNTMLTTTASLELYDESKLVIYNNNTLLVASDLILYGNSTFFIEGHDTLVIINRTFICYDHAFFMVNGSKFFVNGEATFKTAFIINGTFIVNNLAIMDGIVVIKNQTDFAVNGILIINTELTTIEDSLIKSSGDIKIYGVIVTKDSYIFINNGSFIANQNASIKMISSIAIINIGNFIIHESAYVELYNSAFTVLNGGSVDTIGEFYINSLSNITNQGNMNIHSGIYYSDDTTIKTNNVSVENDGQFNVENQTVSINIGFNNNGGDLNIKNNSLFIYEFNHKNGKININTGGSIISDNTINIHGGSILGNGTFDSSINQFNGGEFGSKSTINQFNITGNYTQSGNNSITIIKIDSLDSFSTFNIGGLINLTGNIEIIIHQDLITSSNIQLTSSSSSTPSSLNIINYNSKTDDSFKNIKFKTYTNDGKESDLNNNKCISTKSSSTSFSLLIDSNCNNNNNNENTSITSKLSAGAIAGIVIGCAAFVTISISIFHYRQRIIRSNIGIRIQNIKLIKK